MPKGTNPLLKIETPRGAVYRNKLGEVRLEWKPDFGPRRTQGFQRAQEAFDTECLKLCNKYVPFDTGMLEKSSILCSEIGSGQLEWQTPYARKAYYTPMRFRTTHHPLAGNRWGERCKADNLGHLSSFAKGAVALYGK